MDKRLLQARTRQVSPQATVVLEVADRETAVAWLEAAGHRPEAAGVGLVQVTVPWRTLDNLRTTPGATRLRAPILASPKGFAGGSVLSEGLAPALSVPAWRAQGVDGRSTRVAVVDIGFALQEDLLGVELPPDTRADLLGSSSAHGTAVAEIVADVAPAATLSLHEFRSDVEFLAVLEELEAEQVDVVVASIGFDNVWHPDGTSPMSRAVDRLVRSGVTYVGAAGNEVGRYVSGRLSDADGDGLLEVDGKEGVPFSVVDQSAAVSLRWSEPMASATWDLALQVWSSIEALERGQAPCLVADEDQSVVGPVEAIQGDCQGHVGVAVPVLMARGEGSLEDLEAHLYAPAGVVGTATVEGTLTLPADAALGLAVGACETTGETYREEGLAESYSSQGPTDDGRLKPDLCAAGTVTTRTTGERGFRGTSASAPHAGGLAALIIDGEGLHGAPEAVADRLRARARDLGVPGPDPRYGAGGLKGGTPAQPCRCGTTQPGALWIPGVLVGVVAGRRKRR